LTALVATGAVGSAFAEDAPSKTYIGRLDGAPASVRVGIVCDERRFVAYLCSANDEFNQKWSYWFKGDVTNGAFASENQGLTMTGKVGAGGVEGTFGGEKSAKFSASSVEGDGLAGLYRAAYDEDGDRYVAGWIVDENEEIVGSARNGRGKAVTQRAKAGAPEARAGKEGAVAGQRVVDPANPPDGKLVKRLPPEERAEILRGIAKRAATRGGNPLLGAVVQQAKRFAEGKQPSGPLEKKAFAALKGVPKSILKNYTKNWDALPAATRNAIAGTFSSIGTDRPLTPALVRQAFGVGGKAAADAQPRPIDGLFGLARDPFAGMLGVALQDKAKKAGANIKSIRLANIKCIDPTGFFPGKVNPDEIFMTAVVTSGTEAFDLKSSVYKFAKGQSKPFSAADGRLWPPPGKEAATEEDVTVAFGLFEDDSEDLKKIPALIKTLTKTGAGIVGIVKPETAEVASKVAELSEGLIDGIAAALPETAFLGSESLVISTDGKIRDAAGKERSSVVFREVRRSGNVKFHYVLSDFSVK
jgi:hypothetical protein